MTEIIYTFKQNRKKYRTRTKWTKTVGVCDKNKGIIEINLSADQLKISEAEIIYQEIFPSIYTITEDEVVMGAIIEVVEHELVHSGIGNEIKAETKKEIEIQEEKAVLTLTEKEINEFSMEGLEV